MEVEVFAEFRMSKLEIEYICTLVKDDMELFGSHSVDLTLKEKILICLLKARKSGNFQNCTKDFI